VTLTRRRLFVIAGGVAVASVTPDAASQPASLVRIDSSEWRPDPTFAEAYARLMAAIRGEVSSC
jgi:hypothetical protein